MPNSPNTGICARCGQERPIRARGLCRLDYNRVVLDGTLADYPRPSRLIEDLIEDYQMLRGQGYTRRQIAERLRYNPNSMMRQLFRAKAKGLVGAR